MLSSLNAVISTNESTQFIIGRVIYNPAYIYKFQLKTTHGGGILMQTEREIGSCSQNLLFIILMFDCLIQSNQSCSKKIGCIIYELRMYSASICMHSYGNTGCRVFKRGVQNWKYFCPKINIPNNIIEF